MGDATCTWIGHNPSDGQMVVLPPTASSKCPFDDARVLVVDIDGEGGVKMEMKA